MPNLDLDDHHLELARMLRSFCRGRVPGFPASDTDQPREFPRQLWGELAELGVLGLAAPDSGAGRLDIVVAMEVLGEALVPGPWAATHFAAATLPDRTEQVASGQVIATIGGDGWFPWATEADIHLDLVAPPGAAATVDRVELTVDATHDSLAREPWSAVTVSGRSPVEAPDAGLELVQLTVAAYLAGAAGRVVELAAGHARDRHQFQRPIGDFQAVAHPLARAVTLVDGARQLCRVTAHRADTIGIDVAAASLARLAATRAALDAVHTGHQVMGAVGYTDEGGLGAYSRQIRQLANHPPTGAWSTGVVADAHALATATPASGSAP